MGDYLFCYHKKFKENNILTLLKFSRVQNIFWQVYQSQEQIVEFIKKCKKYENKKGHLTHNFYQIYKNANYKFLSDLTEKYLK